jgi:excisionase family DNA binding protein
MVEKSAMTPIDHRDEPLLFTPEQAARLLGVKPSWLRCKAAARAIPCTFVGKHLRFSRADLEAIITAGGQTARPSRPGGRPGRMDDAGT